MVWLSSHPSASACFLSLPIPSKCEQKAVREGWRDEKVGARAQHEGSLLLEIRYMGRNGCCRRRSRKVISKAVTKYQNRISWTPRRYCRGLAGVLECLVVLPTRHCPSSTHRAQPQLSCPTFRMRRTGGAIIARPQRSSSTRIQTIPHNSSRPPSPAHDAVDPRCAPAVLRGAVRAARELPRNRGMRNPPHHTAPPTAPSFSLRTCACV